MNVINNSTLLVRRISELRPTLKCRSLVVVCSDLHEPAAVHAIAMLAQQHEVAALQFQDPAEITLRGSGFLRAREAESGRDFVTHGRRPVLDQQRITAELRRGGVGHLLIRTDRPFLPRLRHFFAQRGFAGKGAR